MANWKDSARKSLESRGVKTETEKKTMETDKKETGSTKKTATAGSSTSGSWRDSARKSLESRGVDITPNMGNSKNSNQRKTLDDYKKIPSLNLFTPGKNTVPVVPESSIKPKGLGEIKEREEGNNSNSGKGTSTKTEKKTTETDKKVTESKTFNGWGKDPYSRNPVTSMTKDKVDVWGIGSQIIDKRVNERVEELKGVKPEDYVYTPASEGESDFLKGLYKQAEEIALSKVYSLDDMDKIEKNVLKNTKKLQSDYNAEQITGYKGNSDWEAKSKLPKVPEYYSRTHTKEENSTEAALVNLIHLPMDYFFMEENKTDKFTKAELSAIKGATNEQKQAISYLYRTGGSEKVKEYISTFDAKTKLKNDTYSVNDGAFYQAWKKKTDEFKNTEDWEEKTSPDNVIKTRDYLQYYAKHYDTSATRYDYLTEDEIKKLTYIRKSGKDGLQEGNNYLKSLTKELDRRQAEDTYRKSAEFASKHPVLASAKTTGESVLAGLSGVGYAVSDPIGVALTGVDKPIDTNEPRFNIERNREAVMSTVKDKIDSDLGDFAYDTVMSVADNVLRVGVSAAVGYAVGGSAGATVATKYAAPVLMSGGAYQSGMKDALDRGADNKTAIAYGYFSAANEFVTEHIGLDNLANNVSKALVGGKIGQAVLSSTLSEGGEELANAVIELVYDDILMGEKSTYNSRIQYYIQIGKTEEEAHILAMRDTAIDCLVQAASGALSGGIMSAGGVAIGRKVGDSDSTGGAPGVDKKAAEAVQGDKTDNTVQENPDTGISEAREENIQGERVNTDKAVEGVPANEEVQENFIPEVAEQTSDEEVLEKGQGENIDSVEDVVNNADKAVEDVRADDGVQETSDMGIMEQADEKGDNNVVDNEASPVVDTVENVIDNADNVVDTVENVVDNADNVFNRAAAFAESWLDKITVWDETVQNAYQNIKRDIEAIKNNAPENMQSEYDRLLQNFEKKVKNKVTNIDSFARLKMEIPSAEPLTVLDAIDKIKDEIKENEKLAAESVENDGNEAIDSRIKELRKKESQLKLIQKLSDKGVRVNMYSASEANAEGILTPNGVTIGNDIYINIDSTDPLAKTVGHEMLHLLKNENQEAYNNIIDIVKKGFKGKNAEARISYLKEKYGERYSDYYTLDNELFWEEYAADIMGDMSDKNAYGRGILNDILNSDLSPEKKKTAVKAFAEGLRKLIVKVRSVIGKSKYRNYAEMQAYEFVNNAIEIHKEAAKAYRDLVEGRISEGNKKTAAGADVKVRYSVDSTNIELGQPIEEYPYNMQTVIKEYLDAVNPLLLEKTKYFRKNGEIKFERVNFGKVSEKEIEALKNLLNIDFSGYLHSTNSSAIIHINKRHGVNGEHDSSMAKAEDAARVDYILREFDSIDFLRNQNGKIVYSKNFGDKNNKPSPLLLYTKKINGTYYAVVAAGENKYNKLWVETSFIAKNKEGITQALHDEISSLGFTSETPLASLPSYNNLSQDSDIVNTHSMQNEDVKYSVPSSSTIEQRAELENRGYEIETAVVKRLEAALDTKLSEKTREAVKVYSISEAMGDRERISASREKLVDSIEKNENPMYEARTEDDGFLDYIKHVGKVYVSDYARQGMSAADVSRTFGVGKWSGKEGLPVDVLYDNMKADGITLPEADTIQDKLIALRDKKAEMRDKLPRSEIRDIVDYAVDLENYTQERGISENVEIPGLDGESKTVQDAEFMNKRRELESEIDSLDDNDYTQKRKLREEKDALEKNFVENFIRQGRRRSERGIYTDFCRMDKAEEAVLRARLERSENAAREADLYARVHEMTQGMKATARAFAEGSIDETTIDTKYKKAEDRARIKELSELYKRVDYTNKQLRAEQRAALNEACDILFKNASYMRDISIPVQGQIDTFEALVNYMCKVDSIKENMKSDIPVEVRRELIWAAEKINEIFYYPIQENTRVMNEWKDGYLEKLEELDIRKRSAESAAAQALGEGFFNEYDLDKAGFKSEQKARIIALANYLRDSYKEVLQQINAVRFARGEEDIKAPTFKVNKQLKGIISDMQRQVKWLKDKGESIRNLSRSEREKVLETNEIQKCAADAYFTYGKDFEKRIDWREKNAETKSITEMQQWAWNLLMRGKKYDSLRGTIEMDYFPHMEKNDTLDNILAFLNVNKTIDKLPTAINGMTENFRPTKQWSPFMQERLGNSTEFDAVTGAERYFNSMGRYIYHSGDIVKVRILENYLRQTFNAEGNDKYCLSNFASYLRQYGNTLAGKQHMLDRTIQENFVGRKAAQLNRLLMNNVSKNQISYNLGTSITNAAVYAQGIGWVIRESVYEKDIANLQYTLRRNDSIKEHITKSTFLTNRFHDDVVLKDKSRLSNAVTSVQNAGFVPMAVIDKVYITRVHQMMTGVYMSQGMSEEDAISAADIEIRKLAASREYGETPLIYSSNALSVITKYTLEPVNQVRYYKSEIGRMTKAIMSGDDDEAKNAIGALIAFLAGFAVDFAIAYGVNKAFKKLKGYPVFTDPVQMTIDTVEGFKDGKPGGEIWLDILDEIPIVSNIVKAVNGNMAELIGVGAVANFFGNIAKAFHGGDEPDWGEVIWNGITIFNPLGAGAQAKKMVNAYMYLTKGYQENKNGQVQHAVDGSAEDWILGLLFGKSAIPSVQEWHKNNYPKLSKQSSEVFKTVVDEYDLSPEEVYDMLTEYDDKKKDEGYSVYKWVTEDIDKYGKFTVEDKYYLWNKMSKRDCPVPDKMENPEKKIAQVFIATGDTNVLIDRMSDEFSIDGHRNTTTKYYLSEEQQDKLQAEYERILFKEIMPKYMNLQDSESFDNEEWVEFISNAKSKAKAAAQEKAVAEGWYYDSNDTDTTPEDTFEIMKQDREKTGRSSVEAFWIYCDKTSNSFIIPDWENPTKAQQILAETFVACEKEPEGVLPSQRSKSFSQDKVTYLLNEEQYEEFNNMYFMYYWDGIESLEGYSQEARIGQIPKIRDNAHKYAKQYILEKYAGQIETEE
ncbi:MAG: hypothetical protein ACI3XA_04585 [Clostridia bacterium]